MMKVVIAIDSFKGSLSSLQAGTAAATGIYRVDPKVETVVRPLADGGEGTVQALTEGLGGRLVSVSVTGPAGKHLQNCCFQSVKIHIDKRNHRVVCARLRPIALECPIQKQTCHRVWIVYMVISKQIAVVPSSDFLKILSVFLTESGNFIFCESNIGSQRAWIQHGILMKII